ncbi:MAG: V-type ATP synthase subunit F, partial [Nitrospirae bacterium]|nr:V-type ATP synthase subunit F [Nitrospirota bacterium]
MARIAIVTDHDTGLGFRLTGVDVFSASSYQESEMFIERLLKDRGYGLVAYSEEYTESLPESLRIKMEESTLPVFIVIP